MILGDVLVIWRVAAICYDFKLLVSIPILWWGAMIGESCVA